VLYAKNKINVFLQIAVVIYLKVKNGQNKAFLEKKAIRYAQIFSYLGSFLSTFCIFTSLFAINGRWNA